MAELRSKEITSVPGDFQDFKVWAEEILRDHFEDLKQIREEVDIDNGWKFKKDSNGDLIIQEWNTTTETWDDTGWKIKSMQ